MEDPMYRGEANVTTRINHPANAGAAAHMLVRVNWTIPNAAVRSSGSTMEAR